jgi:site-specific recombinase XerC
MLATERGDTFQPARESVKAVADVRHVQELLGHRFIETTARDTQLAIKDLRQVLARAHPRERTRLRRARRYNHA